MLYKILLVDDEEEVRMSMVKKIDWGSIGFQVVAEADNGQDALEKLETLEPDVVLTDIRMPYMDGLELASKMKQRFPLIKIIIFSGYDEFEYAKQAIASNVSEYILKPIDASELNKILRNMKRTLDKEMEDRRDVEFLRQKYLRDIPILKEHFLMDLLNGKIDKSKIQSSLLEFNSHLYGAKKWSVANINIHIYERTESGFSGEGELLPISVTHIAGETMKTFCKYEIVQSSSELYFIAGLSQDQDISDLLTVYNSICKECKKFLHIDITIGVGMLCDDLEELNKSYQEAKDAAGYEAIEGVGSTIYIEDVEQVRNPDFILEGNTCELLISSIKFGTHKDIDYAVEKIVEPLYTAKIHRRQYQAYIIGIMSEITDLIQRYDLDDKSIFGSDKDYLELMTELRDKDKLGSWLLKVAKKIGENLNLERDNTIKNIVSEAKLYIQQNYMNPDLSVDIICKHLNISSAYFSTVFKKETGLSYINYLTDLRLKNAAELLYKTEDKTYMIATKVGYTEQNYFSYVFKKKFGVSPTKYRSSNSMGKKNEKTEKSIEKNI